MRWSGIDRAFGLPRGLPGERPVALLLLLILTAAPLASALPLEDVEAILALWPRDDTVARMSSQPAADLVEALYGANRADLILKALVLKGDRAATFPLLDLLEWQIATASTASGMTAEALGRLGDRRAASRLFGLLVDDSRPAWLRLAAARAVLRLGEPDEVGAARRFLLGLQESPCCDETRPVANRDYDATTLIVALQELGDEGHRSLGRWLLGGTGYFAESLQIAGVLLSRPTPATLEVLLSWGEAIDHEPLVQVELLERLLATDQELDLRRALLLTETLAPSMSSTEARVESLRWRLERRIDGSLAAAAKEESSLALEELAPELAPIMAMERRLRERVEEGWRIPELSPVYLTEPD